MRRRISFSAVLLSLITIAPLHAQSPDSALRAFNTALSEKSAEQLHALLASEQLSVRKGLVSLELHKRSASADDATHAIRYFADALKDSPQEAWVHYGLGATLFRERKTMALVRALGV